MHCMLVSLLLYHDLHFIGKEIEASRGWVLPQITWKWHLGFLVSPYYMLNDLYFLSYKSKQYHFLPFSLLAFLSSNPAIFTSKHLVYPQRSECAVSVSIWSPLVLPSLSSVSLPSMCLNSICFLSIVSFLLLCEVFPGLSRPQRSLLSEKLPWHLLPVVLL